MKTLRVAFAAFVAFAVFGCGRPSGVVVSARHIDLVTSSVSSFDYPETTIVDRYPNEAIFKFLASKYIISRIIQDPSLGRRLRMEKILESLNLAPTASNSDLVDALFAAKHVGWVDESNDLIRIRFNGMPLEIERMLCEVHLVALRRLLKETNEPNNAMERSRILVTDRASARSAPSIRLAHLGR
jgi:hypothetical protein